MTGIKGYKGGMSSRASNLWLLLGIFGLLVGTTSSARADGPPIFSYLSDDIPNFAQTPTDRSVRSGNWSDPGTWSNGVPNTNAVALVEPGDTVTYDMNNCQTTSLAVVGVAGGGAGQNGGTLNFRTDIDTCMKVRTIIVQPDLTDIPNNPKPGTLTIGTPTSPVQAGVKAHIIFADRPLNLVSDPAQFDNGLIGLGNVTIIGKPIARTFAKLDYSGAYKNTGGGPTAGATTLVLDPNETVSGDWPTGATLFVPDTRQLTGDGGVDTGPKYIDQTERPTLQSVSGDGRTLTLASSLQYDHPGAIDYRTNLPVHGPVVAILTRNIVVESENPNGTPAHTIFVGRADVDIEYAEFIGLGRTLPGPLDDVTNHIGRYALHFHHDYGPYPPRGPNQFTAVGNTIRDTQSKWLITIHDSHYGLVKDNVAINGGGALIVVGETGNESFTKVIGNLAAKTKGSQERVDHEDTGGPGGMPFGIWGKSDNNDIERNEVYDIGPTDTPNYNGDNAYCYGFFLAYAPSPVTIVNIPNVQGADTTVGGQYTPKNLHAMPFLKFSDNSCSASQSGGEFWNVNLEGAGEASVIKNLKTWHIYDKGDFNYPGENMVFDGLEILNDATINSGATGFYGPDYDGNVTIKNFNIQGMGTGILPTTKAIADGTETIANGYLANSVNIDIRTLYGLGSNVSYLGPRTTIINNVKFGALPNTTATNIDMNYLVNDVYNYIQTDKVLVTNYNQVPGNNFQVFYNEQRPDFIVPQSMTDPYTVFGSPDAGLTNAENSAKYVFGYDDSQGKYVVALRTVHPDWPGLAIAGGIATCLNTAARPEIYGFTCPIGPAPLSILTTSPLPGGTVGVPYSQTLAATGGTPPYSGWTVTSGSLPAGLNLIAGTGVISGTPTQAGTSNFTIKVVDNATPQGSASQQFALTINSALPPPVITSPLTASGTVGTAFSYQITATNNPTSFNAAGLPAGLSVDTNTGIISGTPASAGTTNVTLSATNSGGTGSATLVLIVSQATQPPTVTLVAPVSGPVAVGTPVTITGTGFVSGAAVTFDGLPATGITVVSATHITATTPAHAAGPVDVVVTNPDGQSSLPLVGGFTYVGPPSFATGSLPNGAEGTAYGPVQLSAAGGQPPYTWSLVSGTLPSGVTLDTTSGIIAGIPTSQGPFTVVLRVTDSFIQHGDSGSLTFTINPPLPVINSPLTASGTVGTPFSYQITATNNPTSFNAAGLPAGLSVVTNTGIISGTPASAGTTNITLSAANSGGTGSATLVLTVNPAFTPPVITVQPSNLTVSVGSAATFTAGASGNPLPTVQWQKSADNGTTWSDITGATSASYTFTTAAGDNNHQFRAVFTNSVGSATSNAATLTVDSPPLITIQPVDMSVVVGTRATFSVTASGSAPLSHQWFKNGSAISGATSAAYTTPVTVLGDNGARFFVRVSNSVGTIDSNTVTLTVTNSAVAPAITTQPINQTVNAGQRAAFTVVATGTNLTYQWRKSTDGGVTFTNIAGATLVSYTTPVTTASDNGSTFDVVVANSAGSVTSNPATLTVDTLPAITTQPTSQTVTAGSNVTFTAGAGGNPLPTVQWQVSTDGGTTFNNIGGATSGAYSFTTASGDNNHKFRAVFTNPVGTVHTNAATLTVNTAPSITTQPSDQTVTAPAAATFHVTASGTTPLTYQWQKSIDDGTTWSNVGTNSTNYTTAATASGDDGTQFRVTVSNTAGSVTSSVVTLTVNIRPAITTQPINQTVNVGQTATFSVTASGTAPLSYQWQKKPSGGSFADISGATSASYITPATTAADNVAQFVCVVTNVAGSVTSNAATLTVHAPPSITAEPTDQTVTDGQTTTFKVTAAGTPPLTYQWQRSDDGGITFTNIPGATGSSYGTGSVDLTDNGAQFHVVVTNVVGSVTSRAAILTVKPALPSITQQPAGQAVETGEKVTFTVRATGSLPLSYQWQKNGTNIPGATLASYTTPTLSLSDNGTQFQVVVTNAAGSVTSNTALLTVTDVPPVIRTQPKNQKIAIDKTATFTVVAQGTNLTYQWRKNGVNIDGATLDSYTTPQEEASDNGATFDVVVTNGAGSLTSAKAVLTVGGYKKIDLVMNDGDGFRSFQGTPYVRNGSDIVIRLVPDTRPDTIWPPSVIVSLDGNVQWNLTLSDTGLGLSDQTIDAKTIAGLAQGSHTLRLQASDNGTQVEDISRTFMIKRTPPSVRIDRTNTDNTKMKAVPPSVVDAVVAFHWTVKQVKSQGAASLALGSPSVPGAPLASPSTTDPQLDVNSLNLAPGSYLVSVVAEDAAGNLSAPDQGPLVVASNDLSSVKVYPNPFRPGQGHTTITFANVPANARIRIYTLQGELMRDFTANGSGTGTWDGNNDSGSHVASGVYFALIEGNGSHRTMKVGVER
jgi:hypothetical protein